MLFHYYLYFLIYCVVGPQEVIVIAADDDAAPMMGSCIIVMIMEGRGIPEVDCNEGNGNKKSTLFSQEHLLLLKRMQPFHGMEGTFTSRFS
mmetsp:Transcript_16992/g.30819  ORF Transcript_16992/g.30819 Transcript_16992/m.30819 type:complete len:91 (+) Transcript_16992:724-996(+)